MDFICIRRGGYDHFEFDITDYVGASRSSSHELIVKVFDPSEFGVSNLFGKQRSDVRPSAHMHVLGSDDVVAIMQMSMMLVIILVKPASKNVL